MAKNDEFELDFDFEKEYGFAPEDIMAPEGSDDDDFDIDLSDEDLEILRFERPAQSAAQPAEEAFASDEDYDKLLEEFAPTMPEERAEEPVAAAEEALSFEDVTGVPASEEKPSEEASFEEFDELPGAAPVQPPVPVAPVIPPVQRDRRRGQQRRQNPLKAQSQPQPAQPQNAMAAPAAGSAPANPRRKQRSQMRIIKEDYLPLGIAGVALLLCLIFIVGSVIRTVNNNRIREENEIAASEQAASEAARLEQEVQELRERAAELAAGYDFDGAIAMIDSFSGNINDYTSLMADRSQYIQVQSTMVEITDFKNIPNLSFHVLIADPATAFHSEPYGPKYRQNFVTIDEFQRILEQLYENGYVLVNFDDFIEEIPNGSGGVTFQTKSIKLPAGKKPIMLTETLVNYFEYMVDGDDDGVADKDGDGFACKLVVKDGKVTAERINSAGETVYGAFDLVPILDAFIEAHPDFSYRGAKATLAVTGDQGIFGYRIQDGDSDEMAACAELVQALRDSGYLLACNSYSNVSYNTINATAIQEDLEKWKNNIVPVIGDVDILVYALASDISDYNGSKYNVMANAGFKYFISNTTNSIPTMEVNTGFVRQYRIMVTGTLMVNSPNNLSDYFNVAEILSNER